MSTMRREDFEHLAGSLLEVDFLAVSLLVWECRWSFGGTLEAELGRWVGVFML